METKKTYFAYVTLNDYIILFNHHIITPYMFMEIIWKQKKLNKTYFAYVTLNDYIILFNHHIITPYMFMEIIWKQKKLKNQ
jgi:hypothetical protein